MGKRYIPGHLSQKNKRKKVNIIAIELVVCVALTLVMVGAVIGKYLHKFDSYGSVRALNFYFTSNLLDGGTHNLAPGTQELTFTLGNHADELRFSEMDIKYMVTIANEDGTASAATITNNSGTMSKDSKKDVNITVSNLQPGKYTITAVGDGGYSQTLTAKIVIPAAENKLYYYIDNSAGDYILLTVWNEGNADSATPGNVTVKYTGIPDNTNPNMTDWHEATSEATQSVEIFPNESKVFRFFGNANVKVEGAASKVLN